MIIKGIQIFDHEKNVLLVNFLDILETIEDGNTFYWTILNLNANGKLANNDSILKLEKQINESEKGLKISWKNLLLLATKLNQIINLIVIGFRDKDIVLDYSNLKELRKVCDLVIEMKDSSFWIIYSKNPILIKKIANKFNQTKNIY